MTPVDHDVETSLGRATYIEVEPGGDPDGVDVLMLHPPIMCSSILGGVYRRLSGTSRIVSLDLPGHAQTDVVAADPLTTAAWVTEVIGLLKLDKPLLLGLDLSGFVAAVVAKRHPELVSGLVTVGDWCLNTREGSAERLEMVTDPEMLDELTERMLIGVTGPDRQSERETREGMAELAAQDWLIDDRAGAFVDQIGRIFKFAEDGSWVRRPDHPSYLKTHDLNEDSPEFPERELLKQLSMPVLALVGEEGIGADLVQDAIRDFRDLPNIRVTYVRGGNMPQMTHPMDIAEVVSALVEDIRATENQPRRTTGGEPRT